MAQQQQQVAASGVGQGQTTLHPFIRPNDVSINQL